MVTGAMCGWIFASADSGIICPLALRTYVLSRVAGLSDSALLAVITTRYWLMSE